MQRVRTCVLMLVAALLVLLTPPFVTTAWAAKFKVSNQPYNYSQLSAASSAVSDGGTITMLEDSSGKDCYMVLNRNVNVTLDLGGYTLTVGGYKNAAADYYGIEAMRGTITVKNGTILSTSNHTDPINAIGGTIILGQGLKVESKTSVIQAMNGGKVIVNGAQVVTASATYAAAFATGAGSSIELRSGSISQTSSGFLITSPPTTLSVKNGASATISGGSLYSGMSTAMVSSGVGSLITVTGGKVSNNGKNGQKSGVNGYWAAHATDGGRIYLRGGEISSDYGNGLYATGNNKGGSLEVSGGTLSVGTTGYALLARSSVKDGSKAVVSNGSIRGKVGVGGSDAGTSSLTITGGTVDGQVTKSSGVISISGGTFTEGVEKTYCANGYTPVSTNNESRPKEVKVIKTWDVTVSVAGDQVYAGSALTPAVVVKTRGGAVVSTSTYSVAYANNIEVGTASVTVTCTSGSDAGRTADGTFKVTPRPVLAKASDASKIYGEKDPTFTASFTAVEGKAESGLVSGHVGTATVSRNSGENAASYQLKLGKAVIKDANGKNVTANYAVESSAGRLTIAPRPLTFTWPSDDTFAYDSTEKTITATANTVNEDTLTLTYEGNSAVDVGEHVARVTGFSGGKMRNYVLNADEPTATHEWYIGKRPIQISIVVDDWTYGKQPSEPVVVCGTYPDDELVTCEYRPSEMSGMAAMDEEPESTESGYTEVVPTQAGSYTVRVTVDESEFYQGGTATADFRILPADIVISADDKASMRGSEPMELTYRVSGDYVEGDDLGVDLYCEVGSASEVGTYPIEVSWNENPNYEAMLWQGSYAVTNAEMSVSAADYTGVYDGDAHGIVLDVPEAAGISVWYATESFGIENYQELASSDPVTRTNAGSTTVYYLVVGEAGEYVAGSKEIVIRKAPVTDIADDDRPAAITELVADKFNPVPQELVKSPAHLPEGIEGVEYRVYGGGKEWSEWSEAIPTGTLSGSYTVRYRLVCDDNHESSEVGILRTNIGVVGGNDDVDPDPKPDPDEPSEPDPTPAPTPSPAPAPDTPSQNGTDAAAASQAVATSGTQATAKLPKTGDGTRALEVASALIGAAGVLVLLCARKQRERV